jgi:hypothetical protein
MSSIRFGFHEREFRKAVMDAGRKGIEDRIRGIRCPKHHQSARVRFSGSGDNLKSCCQKLIDAVMRMFA